jgi:hypothetical protein
MGLSRLAHASIPIGTESITHTSNSSWSRVSVPDGRSSGNARSLRHSTILAGSGLMLNAALFESLPTLDASRNLRQLPKE